MKKQQYSQTGYVYSDELLNYRFHNKHPFNQMRLKLTTELLQCEGLLHDHQMIKPRQATIEEIASIHKYDYIEAIRRGERNLLNSDEKEKYGLNEEDTHLFPKIHSSAATIVGGGLNLIDAIMAGQFRNGCHLGGGLHHALEGRANGFCVYNDAAIYINHLIKNYHQRVLYIDTDAHHGDGIQWCFYNSDQVLNYSIHETGKFLFPGSGHYSERGTEQGFGYSINLPLEPFTEHDSYIEVFTKTIEKIAERFKPDFIVSVNGSDIHYLDPLTHMHCNLNTLYQIPYIVTDIAEKYCEGRQIMLGGGGYNIWRVVPRAWSHLFLSLIHHPPLKGKLSSQWLNKWKQYSPVHIPEYWEEQFTDYTPIPRRHEITEKNRTTSSYILNWF
ncbi:acetoin utilization protein AcuC [Staphylococcus felis]|uniref:acetoin utilization protein AcuC n=1 Tax=Staphylococcus felis TaxID=46127 RepID=UPI000CD31D7C|nr:acetoin utilization protein AcuC [Staphylococcus felis]AVP37320.1 acetoin utilization protein AcuC [Staphylococcus felis]PNZ36604.1 acetoin utilization protein AcuC [Staphylococcus felis]QQB02732.1 acetoin utilization protein AcuC [Staphylococcus felis]REH79539.1 acetoin utilization protein AcuC [Staphylococcus felis]REI08741.1 acetoin utilization protein AcuC [Staphylococcus felis]